MRKLVEIYKLNTIHGFSIDVNMFRHELIRGVSEGEKNYRIESKKLSTEKVNQGGR